MTNLHFAPNAIRDDQEQVRAWMQIGGQACPDRPCIPPEDVWKLRIELLREEIQELEDAYIAGDLVEVADAYADIQVVNLGGAVASGIKLAPHFAEVMRSNESKYLGGVLKRDDGKIMKGPHYSPPNLAPILAAQSEPKEVHEGEASYFDKWEGLGSEHYPEEV